MSCNYCTAYNREDEHHSTKKQYASALDKQLVHSYDNITYINK